MLRPYSEPQSVELSLVIPVFNSRQTLERLVEQIHEALAGVSFEVILVNDGSSDGSDALCNALAEKFPGTVCAVQLAGNFGEHNAVMAGLKLTAGRYVAVLDDDGQNPPHEIPRMLAQCKAERLDVVYGRPQKRQHSWFRRAGSWFHNRVANLALGKPRQLYLSSFKVMRRWLVEQVIEHSGPHLYLDSLVLRAARRVGQIEVQHRPRQAGRSGYTFAKLVHLWWNMVLGSRALRRLAPSGDAPQYIVRALSRLPVPCAMQDDVFTVCFDFPRRDPLGAETGWQ